MSKWLKIAFFTALLIGTGYFFGTICRQVGHAYELILTPSRELLALLLWFLLAVGALIVSAGLVAALLRPVWVGCIAFALSGLTTITLSIACRSTGSHLPSTSTSVGWFVVE